MSKHGKKIVFLGMEPSNELAIFMHSLYRNGFEFVITKHGKKYHRLMDAFNIPRISLRVYKPRIDKLSLAIVEASVYAEHVNRLQKCPVLVDSDDFKWYIDQVSNSHDGRISDTSFSWLRIKVMQLSSHSTLMEWIESSRP